MPDTAVDTAVCTHMPKEHRRVCHLHKERKSLYLPQRRGREHHLLRVQPRKFVTLSCSSPEGPKKSFSKYFRPDRCIDWVAIEQVQMADAIRALLTIDPWELFFGIIEPTCLELTICSTFHLQTIMTNYDDLETVQFRLGSAGTLWPLAQPPIILAVPGHQFSHHP
ncbi:hypothetical protein GOBAR_AA39513 [Gossypium barbadense]|uniref:Uncharacterized protein n=1 Tax=Gossypium barbadense TaxID=3634 RepID=A0A2P5VQW9_GOSBA|nr:hypothetical protein GOBAR_AA39513 [Gossypium barbadense]